MNEAQHDGMDAMEPVEAKAEWIRPEVDKLLAGAAENSSGADVDAADLTS